MTCPSCGSDKTERNDKDQAQKRLAIDADTRSGHTDQPLRKVECGG